MQHLRLIKGPNALHIVLEFWRTVGQEGDTSKRTSTSAPFRRFVRFLRPSLVSISHTSGVAPAPSPCLFFAPSCNPCKAASSACSASFCLASFLARAAAFRSRSLARLILACSACCCRRLQRGRQDRRALRFCRMRWGPCGGTEKGSTDSDFRISDELFDTLTLSRPTRVGESNHPTVLALPKASFSLATHSCLRLRRCRFLCRHRRLFLRLSA